MTDAQLTSHLTNDVDVFKALADPVRLDLLMRIVAVDEMSCTNLVNEAGVTASTVSYHIKTLRAAGLVAVRKDGRNFHYTARVDALHSLRDFFGALVERRQHEPERQAAATS